MIIDRFMLYYCLQWDLGKFSPIFYWQLPKQLYCFDIRWPTRGRWTSKYFPHSKRRATSRLHAREKPASCYTTCQEKILAGKIENIEYKPEHLPKKKCVCQSGCRWSGQETEWRSSLADQITQSNQPMYSYYIKYSKCWDTVVWK